MTAPADRDEGVQLDVNELLNAHTTIAAQQISGLIRRNAELEATVLAMRRLLVEATTPNATPHPKPRAVGGD